MEVSDPDRIIQNLRAQVSSLEEKVEELTSQLQALQEHTSEEKIKQKEH